MADIGMGKLVEHDEVVMDAVHVAVVTMTACGKLHPGDDVGFDDTNDRSYVTRNTRKAVGIVDPFLKNPVKDGERFWLFLYPNSTTPMRHSWKHPDFDVATAPQVPNKVAAEKWLREFAEDVDLTYNTVIQAGRDYNERQAYYVQKGTERAMDAMYANARADFWRNWSIVTGEVVTDPDGTVFSCSC